METIITNKDTSLGGEEVIVRAVQFFSTEKWRITTQTSRSVTFQGRPRIPWFMICLTILGFFICLLPGIILYVWVIRKMYGFVQLVITVSPISGGSQICIQSPKTANKLVNKFVEALPPLSV